MKENDSSKHDVQTTHQKSKTERRTGKNQRKPWIIQNWSFACLRRTPPHTLQHVFQKSNTKKTNKDDCPHNSFSSPNDYSNIGNASKKIHFSEKPIIEPVGTDRLWLLLRGLLSPMTCVCDFLLLSPIMAPPLPCRLPNYARSVQRQLLDPMLGRSKSREL